MLHFRCCSLATKRMHGVDSTSGRLIVESTEPRSRSVRIRALDDGTNDLCHRITAPKGAMYTKYFATAPLYRIIRCLFQYHSDRTWSFDMEIETEAAEPSLGQILIFITH